MLAARQHDNLPMCFFLFFFIFTDLALWLKEKRALQGWRKICDDARKGNSLDVDYTYFFFIAEHPGGVTV